MMDRLKAGDIVKLKSGGPHMTVTGEDESNRDSVYVAWFTPVYNPPSLVSASMLPTFNNEWSGCHFATLTIASLEIVLPHKSEINTKT